MNNNRSSAADVAMRWWSGLQPYRDGIPNPVADRGALARLRRADLIEAMEDPATFDLFRQLGWRDPVRLIDAALCAGVLAVVRDDSRTPHAARQLGVQPGGDDRPVLSALRFRRLIAAETPQDRLTALRRAVLLANATTNVRDVAAACLDWSDERRRRWAFEYYNAANAAPQQPTVLGETIQ